MPYEKTNWIANETPISPTNMNKIEQGIANVFSACESHFTDNTKQIPHLGTTTNVGNDYSIETTETILANQKFTISINVASTGVSTLNVSTIGGAKGIKKPGGLDANLKVGVYTFFYDGVNFQLLGEGGETSKPTNVIKNGNFNSTNCWNSHAGAMTIADNILTFLASARFGGPMQTISSYSTYKAHKVYARAEILVDNALTYLVINDGVNQIMVYPSTLNQYCVVSGIREIDSNATTVYVKIQDGRESNWTEFKVKRFMAIDITDVYGVGNEPDKATMDQIVDSFDGWWDSPLPQLTDDTVVNSSGVLLGYTFYSKGVLASGTMPNRAGDTQALSSLVLDNTLKLLPSNGYRDGIDDYVTITDVDFTEQNIVKDKNLFGKIGTYDKKYGVGDLLDISQLDGAILNVIPTVVPGAFSNNIVRVKLSRDKLHVLVLNGMELTKRRLSDGSVIFSYNIGLTSNDFAELANGEIVIVTAYEAGYNYLRITNADGTFKQNSPALTSSSYYLRTVTADDNNNVCVYTSDKYMKKFDGSFNLVFSTLCTNSAGIRLTYHGGILVCGDLGSGKKVTFVDAITGTLLAEPATINSQTSLGISDRYVIIGQTGGVVYIYNRLTGGIINGFILDTSDAVVGLDFDLDDTYYYVIQTGSSSGTSQTYLSKIVTISADVVLSASGVGASYKDSFLNPNDGKLYSGFSSSPYNNIAYHKVKHRINS